MAVPYVGARASKQLNLRRGDILLCALTKANCRAGAVCPAELRVFQDRGVRLYQQADLHAKVYLLNRTLIVTSANLSGAARDVLDEIGVVSTDRDWVREVKAWFRARLTQPVTPEWLKECEQVYRPPRGPLLGPKSRNGPKTPAMRVWLMNLSSIDPPADEQAIRKTGETIAKQRKTPRSTVEWLRFAGKPQFLERLSDGDAIVQIWKDGSRSALNVYPSARLLHYRMSRGRRGRVAYLFIEELSDCRTLTWAGFKKACAEQGLQIRKPAAVQEIRGAKNQRALLSVASPDRLSSRSV